MALDVIGAGFGRTGTHSLKLALEQLGFAKCYHMLEVSPRPGHVAAWLAAARGEGADWDRLFEGYRAAVDWPAIHFWRELKDFYPEAKIVLTPRDPESWWKSFSNTILPVLLKGAPKEESRQDWFEMVRLVLIEGSFGGDLSKENILSAYEAHNEAVRRGVPKDRLLEYDVKQGWEPLCTLLGVDVPQTEFPRSNSTEEFHQLTKSNAH